MATNSSDPLPIYVKPAVVRFKELEKAFLANLSSKDKKVLAHGNLEDFTPHHLYFYGEVAFTLGKLKPCVLIAHGSLKSFAGSLVSTCLRPVMEAFQLESHGFQVHEITHKFMTSNPAHPGFQGAFVFVNTNHPDYALVPDVFLKGRPDPVPELLIGRALGYPLPYGDGEAVYMDASEMEAAGVCCVYMLEYTCDKFPTADQCVKLLMHFHKHSSFWKQLGWSMSINVDKCPGAEQYMFSARRAATSPRS